VSSGTLNLLNQPMNSAPKQQKNVDD